MTKSSQRKKKIHGSGDTGNTGTMEDWISALAHQQAHSSNGNGSSIEQGTSTSTPLSKAERIQRRQSKKKRREDRKSQQKELEAARKSKRKRGDGQDPETNIKSKVDQINSSDIGKAVSQNGADSTSSKSRSQLERISQAMQLCVAQKRDFIEVTQKSKWRKPYISLPVKTKKRRSDRSLSQHDLIQPKRSNYGGIGVARASLWIALDDPSWQPKLEEEFSEHIVGFYGKQRTKAMKKQRDGNMLWRQLLQEKQKKSSSSKGSSTKASCGLSPDERVEAMLKAGLI